MGMGDSHHTGFLVHAEDGAEAVADFADGGVSADAVEDGGQEVVGGKGGLSAC